MARTRQFAVSAINIRVHSKHEPAEYVALWRKLFSYRRVITRGAYGLMIGDMRWLNDDQNLGLIFGYFYSFVQIDPRDPWFNVKDKRPADEAEVGQVNIPEGLKPNLKSVPYIFDVKKHQLAFVVEGPDGGVSANLVHKLLENLTSGVTVVDRFGQVDLTIMTDRGEIEAMLNWPVIRRLEVVLERPNGTDYEDELEVVKRFKKLGISREERTYVKADGATSITPDETMKTVAHIAANNGFVLVKGKNPQGKSDAAKSQQFPMVMRTQYSPKEQTLIGAFVDFVRDKISKR